MCYPEEEKEGFQGLNASSARGTNLPTRYITRPRSEGDMPISAQQKNPLECSHEGTVSLRRVSGQMLAGFKQ